MSAAYPKPCEQEILIETTEGISVRQRGADPTVNSLRYILKETDWKNNEKLAYNSSAALEIVAKVV